MYAISIIFALVANICFASASLLFTDFSRRTSVYWMNMFKCGVSALSCGVAFLFTDAAVGAVDVKQATEEDLDGSNGIGPGLSQRILAEREKGEFKDWADLIERVKGIGDKTATKFSAGGLTVQGKRFNAAAWARAQAKAKNKEGTAPRQTPTKSASPASQAADPASQQPAAQP